MDSIRANSSPQLVERYYKDSSLEGVAANVKLLLKLIQEHKASCYNEKKDGRKRLRVVTMMTILDNIRSRIQKCQSFGKKKSPEDLQGEGPCHLKKEENHLMVDDEEKEKLKKDLNASLAARKNLEIMCSSLGREKEIIAAELSMKVHQLNETDEIINDLKEQNASLLKKLHERASNDNAEKILRNVSDVVETQENIALQQRNKMLSAQLLRSLDGYRSMKRKYKEEKEDNIEMCATLEEIGMKVRASLDHIHGFKGCPGLNNDVQKKIINLELMFESLELQVAKHEKKKGESPKLKG